MIARKVQIRLITATCFIHFFKVKFLVKIQDTAVVTKPNIGKIKIARMMKRKTSGIFENSKSLSLKVVKIDPIKMVIKIPVIKPA
jgi:hypothetical protein